MKNLERFRRERLTQLADKMGGKAPLGRRLGHQDGAYIGQMIRGERPITEKTILSIESLPGCKGWFTALGDDETSNVQTNLEAHPELAALVHDFDAIPAPITRLRKVWALSSRTGAVAPEQLWEESSERPIQRSGWAASLASPDPKAFLVEIGEQLMVPRLNPGEFALIEPSTLPELEDDVLVRFRDGRISIQRLASRRDGYRLSCLNGMAVAHFPASAITWMYYVAHSVPRSRVHFEEGK